MFEIQKDHTVSSLIVKQVIENINLGNLRAGDYLPTERELAETFGVGRNTVRESLRILETYGVVETARRKPPKIINKNIEASLNIATIRFFDHKNYFTEIQQIRDLLEVGLVNLIVENATPELIYTLKKINEGIKKSETISHLAELDYKFHECLVSISGNKMASAVYQSLSSAIKQVLEIGKDLDQGIITANQDHARIITAIESRDCLKTKDLLGQHFKYSQTLFAS